jgi:hypothetical protein
MRSSYTCFASLFAAAIVLRLRRLLATREQNDHLGPALQEVHAVAGADVDPHLRDTVTYGFAVPEVPGLCAIDARLDAGSRAPVAQAA